MLTRDSTEPADPGWSHHWRSKWSHHWRKGGPITLAELLPSGPIPLAGDTNFDNYRIRALLYAGRPNWDLLATITPR